MSVLQIFSTLRSKSWPPAVSRLRFDYEVPFIFNHRKDYLIHAPSDRGDVDDNASPPPEARPERLLNQSDLWEVFDLDLKFRAFSEKRDALVRNYENLRSVAPEINDVVIDELVSKSVTIEEIQELQDYLHFQYSTEMKDLRLIESESNGVQKRANNARTVYDKIRATSAYSFVHAIGISADDFAKFAEGAATRRVADEYPAGVSVDGPGRAVQPRCVFTAWSSVYAQSQNSVWQMNRSDRDCGPSAPAVPLIKTQSGRSSP